MAAALEEEKGISSYRLNADTAEIHGADLPWVAGSGCRGPIVLDVNVIAMPSDTEYRVRLHFAELQRKRAGDRVFDVMLGSRTVLSSFDVMRAAGQTHTAIVKEFTTDAENGAVHVELVPRTDQPILSGIEVLAQ
jgi:hypothetical protein